MRQLLDQLRGYYLYMAWVQALIATFGSLYFSEVMHLTPCTLCWYQRILMYPLAFILAVGILRDDDNSRWYALPLSITGLCIAIYHNLLYYNLIPQSLTTCAEGVSCTTRYVGWLGFITIPLLSAIAFLFITTLLFLYKKKS